MTYDEEYTKKLEDVIKQMLQPLRNVPFNLVIENICGCKVTPFIRKDIKDKAVLKKLIKVAKITGKTVNQKGIKRSRPNEVGNDIEPFVINSLITIGYNAGSPLTRKGGHKKTGYPDIEFIDEFNRVNYLECKTFNIDSFNTTMRSFYLSPSEDFKITHDAHHFVLSFEIFVDRNVGKNNIYKCKNWKILSIEKLAVDVKYEFNADNQRLYANKLILAQGDLD
ncbi:MAG: hypothetical protein A4E53_00684 [Pelotomaculum sp. PtaB.Bin104]|nr:MAG: hypothetical protein A4E53_00684 [Pelotomaculum sp. PtaB.Bin104]